MTLAYNPRLAKFKVDPHAKNHGQTVQTEECPQQTDGRYQTYYLPCFAVDNNDFAAKLLQSPSMKEF